MKIKKDIILKKVIIREVIYIKTDHISVRR